MRLLEGAWLALLIASGCGEDNGDVDNPDDGGPSCESPLEFPAPIDGDVEIQAGCYRVSESVTVSSGHQLTLRPGVTLLFASGVRLFIDEGRLNAEGTASAPILLTGEQQTRGYWEGVRFNRSDFVENVFDYVTIEYAGGDGSESAAALYLDDDGGPIRLTATNTTIRQSAGYGLYLESNQNRNNLDWSQNVVTENALAARILAKDLRGLTGDSTWTGNDADYVVTGDRVSEDATWRVLDVPYRVRFSIDIEESTITVQPGATFEHEQEQGISVGPNAGLDATGTEAEPITFTGVQKTRGFWEGLSFESSNSVDNVLEHVVVEYGGGGDDTAANVRVDDDQGPTRIIINDSILRESGAWALFFEVNQNTHDIDGFENNVVTANARAVRIGAEDAGELSKTTTFSGNDEDYVQLARSVRSIQTWQALDAPYRVPGVLTIEEGAEVAIEAGATVEFGQGAGLDVEGALAADGTMDAPVLFTGTQGTPGFWDAITYDSTNSLNNRLVHAVLEYGGGATNDPGGLVYLDDDQAAPRLTVDNSVFRESSNWGIYVENNQNDPILTCTNPTFETATLAEGAVGNDGGALPNLCN